MATTTGKRWNGNVDSLGTEFLKGVLEKMNDYGDRVRFSLVSGGPAPSYQILNRADKAMAFDRNHHLLRADEDIFAGANATRLFTLEQIKDAVAGQRIDFVSSAKGARVPRASGGVTRASAARLAEQHAAERYAYFKQNRDWLPATIAQHTEEIDELMKAGKSAEQAFDEVVKKYY